MKWRVIGWFLGRECGRNEDVEITKTLLRLFSSGSVYVLLHNSTVRSPSPSPLPSKSGSHLGFAWETRTCSSTLGEAVFKIADYDPLLSSRSSLVLAFSVPFTSMSAATRLTTLAGILTTSAAILGISSLPSIRDFLAQYLGANGSRNAWRAMAFLLALINLKNLPGLWHVRVLRGIFYQLYLQPTPQQPKHLFAPMITSSYNTLYDCDYNFHKSNSTYFADLDVARAHYMGCIIRTGLARLNKGDEQGLPKDTTSAKGKYVIALGGVSCFFQRQIEPLQSFEIYTRLLSWDRKWVYLVSHIVKKGAIKPDSYVLQPWKKSGRRPSEVRKDDEDLSKHIFATSVARYVFKKGRLTMNPEIVLERSRLLPARPAGVGLPPRTESLTSSATPVPSETPSVSTQNGSLTSPEAVASQITVKLGEVASQTEDADDGWTWDDMEKERLRGLQIASHFDSLSAAHGELRAGEVLGRYGDYW